MPFNFNTLVMALRAASSAPAIPALYLNVSSADGYATAARSQGNGGVTSVPNGVIQASLLASCTTGVAPLYVNFDMTNTKSKRTKNPTHDLYFETNFGDPGSGNWDTGVQSAGVRSKNIGIGPITGHTFETPGTYLVVMTATDGANPDVKIGVIVVQDPDVVYSGTNTICLSHTGSYIGAPSGSQQPVITGNTDITSLWNTYKGSNKRILFNKADNWTCSAQINFTNITDTIVGGYGTGVARAPTFTSGSGTLVNVDASAVSGSIFGVYSGCSNIKVCDFKSLGGGQATTGVSLNNTVPQFLAYKLEFRNVLAGFNAPPGQGPTRITFDQHCMYECVVDSLWGEPFIDTPRATCNTTNGSSVFSAVGHPFAVGRLVNMITTAPGGTSTSTDYYVLASGFGPNAFQVSLTANGAAITLTSTGSFLVANKTLNGGIGAFVGLTRGGLMGCYFDTGGKGEQTLRCPLLDRAHITNNYLARPNQAKNLLKIHSFIYDQLAVYTEKFVVSGNVLDDRNNYAYNGTTSAGVTITEISYSTMTIGNGGSAGYERVRNGIVEHNYMYGCRGEPKTLLFANIHCPNMTIRNNIADFLLGTTGAPFVPAYQYPQVVFIDIGVSSEDDTVDVRVFNNTMYSNMSQTAATLAWLTTGSDGLSASQTAGISIKGNISAVPNVHATWDAWTIYNPTNILDISLANNPALQSTPANFTATPPVAIGDWKPATGSYAIKTTGSPVCLRDFHNVSRVGGFDHSGAVLP